MKNGIEKYKIELKGVSLLKAFFLGIVFGFMTFLLLMVCSVFEEMLYIYQPALTMVLTSTIKLGYFLFVLILAIKYILEGIRIISVEEEKK